MTMKLHNLLIWASLLGLVIDGAGAALPSSPDKTTSGSKSVAVAPSNPESALKKAMPADVVRKIMGTPQEIKPMKAPEGKAEIWVYQRMTNERVEQVEIGSVPITISVIGGDGQARQQTVGEDIKYGDLHLATEETVELLMFNDQYVTNKVSRREIKRYN
jgi:hypothetical protein